MRWAASSGVIGIMAKRFDFTMRSRAVGRRRSRRRAGSATAAGAVGDDPAAGVVAPLELRLELVELVLELGSTARSMATNPSGACDLAAHVVTVALEGDLADLPVGDARVALLGEVDLGSVHAVEEPVQPPDLLLGHAVGGCRTRRCAGC